MAAMHVEGQDLLPKDFNEDLGWRTVSSRRSRALTKPGLGDGDSQSEMPERKGAGERRGLVIKKRIMKASRMPPMPEEHIKIVIRPRGGLNLEKVSPTTVGNAVVDAAGLSSEQTKEDIICPNFKQNILVASTPERSNAERARTEIAAEQEAAEAAQLAHQHSKGRSRSRSRSRSRQRPATGTPAAKSRSVSRGAHVRFPAAGGGGGAAGGHTTWADKAKGFTTTGRAREQRQEHVSSNKDKDRIAQLERENHSLKAAIEGLTKEIAELRSALPSGNSDSLRQGSKHDDPVEVRRSVEVAEENMADEETPAPKKRALSSKVRAQGKVGSELKEIILTLQESVNKVITRLEQIEEREMNTVQRLGKIEVYLNETVVPGMERECSQRLVQQSKSPSGAKPKISTANLHGQDGSNE
ncbi:hypothetical protein HPB50_011359 [Hyalomma asiaticum]|uniref:Uncharacterized protein n=1 Tax=Hyalomma asiaticum TaxID=266040 RepID=A0ACB7SUW5_HYAAI|nr:hypothetical protein HPB50_011359 [Hyalomma asiaticum]